MATEITRSYIDNYSVKDFAINELVPKYFDEEDVSDRTIGMVGYTTELLSNISEDAFNMGSVLFRESFPNRAEIPESIYSHAAIFQLGDVLAKASACKFILVLDEKNVIDNAKLTYERDAYNETAGHDGIYRFYIDKDTIISIDDYDYSIDYDIMISIVEKTKNNGTDGSKNYIFTAKYMMPNYYIGSGEHIYNNSISDLKDPYVKVRRSGDGFLALEIDTHQMYREVEDETITSNTVVNYSTIDVTYYGQLAGFEVLYKGPDDDDYIQLETRVAYSQPTSDPFCYYQMVDDSTFRLSFNTQDQYFTPEFNAKLKVVKYITDGEAANFDLYSGDNISITTSTEVYNYSKNFLSAAQPIGSSSGGADQGDLDELQAITVENYRTATALTTTDDLQQFFNNYKYYYNNSDILFIKKRDDIYERVYSAFSVMKYLNYIYNTTTMKLKLNIDEMENPEINVYKLEPGYLFTANDNDRYAKFLRDESLTLHYFADYKKYVEKYNSSTDAEFEEYIKLYPNAKHVRYIDDSSEYSLVPEYLKRTASFASYKSRIGVDDKKTIFDDDIDYDTLDDIINLKFLVVNPFLIYFRKKPNCITTYMTYVHNQSLVDFTNINDDSFIQFIMTTLTVNREFEKERKYKISLKVTPNVELEEKYNIVDIERDSSGAFVKYKIGDEYKYNVENNSLRIIVEMRYNESAVCYTELYPTDMSTVNNQSAFVYSNYVYTDDHISSDNRLRLLDGKIYRFYKEWTDTSKEVPFTYEEGYYFKVKDNDNLFYNLYNSDNELVNSTDYPVNDVTKLYKELSADKILRIYKNVINVNSDNNTDILIPMDDCICKVWMVYNKVVNENGEVVPSEETVLNPITYIDTDYFKNYQWTNEYTTGTYPISFMKTLNSVRTYLSFEDYTYEVSDGTETEDEDGTYTLYKNAVTGFYYRKPSRESTTYTLYDFNKAPVQTDIEEEEVLALYNSDTETYIKTTFVYDIMDAQAESFGLLRAKTINKYDGDGNNYLDKFLDLFAAQYDFLTNIIYTRLRNETNIDFKFYNTYGRSNSITIGEYTSSNDEDAEILDTINLRIEFDVWFIDTYDTDSAIESIKEYIKQDIETLNANGLNSVHISNLMRKIETNFAYVDHMRFIGFNSYSPEYQTLTSKFTTIEELSVMERREYVPEMIVIDTNDITIHDYTV